jgi:histidinol-phosphate aminotransferase
MIKAPDYIRNITPYVPGKPIEELERDLGLKETVKLASNENPLGPSPLALKAIRKGMGDLNRYPDGSGFYLKQALSSRLKISPEEIILGNGSNEIIEIAVRTFLRPGDEAIMAHPSFVVYPTVCQAVQGRNIVVPLKEWRHDLDSMAKKITKKTKVIFIANPNNPTGTINTETEMTSFIKKVPPYVLLIVDEAYCEYVSSPEYADSINYFRKARNIVILRTFSKIYGLAGLRIGYGIAHKSIVAEMNKVRQPFNVNSLAQGAAIAALNDAPHLEKSRSVNEKGKRYLYRKFKELGVHCLPTQANFIYITFRDNIAIRLYEHLLNKGVIIRPMGPKAVRVTVGRENENRILIKAWKRVGMETDNQGA